jgi:hypothetical protein
MAKDDEERSDEYKSKSTERLIKDAAGTAGAATGLSFQAAVSIFFKVAKQDKPEAVKLAKNIGITRDALKSKAKIEENVDRLKEMNYTVDDAKSFAKEKLWDNYEKKKAKYDKEMENLEDRNDPPSEPKPPSEKYIKRMNSRIEKRWDGDYSRDVEDVQDDAYKASGNRDSKSRKAIDSAVAHLKREKVTRDEAVTMIRKAAKRKYEESMDKFRALKAHERGRMPERITLEVLEIRIANLKKAWRR